MEHEFVESTEFREDITFGKFLRKKRRLMGLNQTDFGEKLGYTQGAISSWELEKTAPPIDEATEIIRRIGGKIRICNIQLWE